MPAINGLVRVKATSTANTGGTATQTTNGEYVFTGVTSARLDGIFTSIYDDYLMVFEARANGASPSDVNFRFTTGGTDRSTASTYRLQQITASGSSLTNTSSSLDYGRAFTLPVTNYSGFNFYVYWPARVYRSGIRSVSALSDASGTVVDRMTYHMENLSSDGIRFYSTVAFDMSVNIYAFNQ